MADSHSDKLLPLRPGQGQAVAVRSTTNVKLILMKALWTDNMEASGMG